MFPLNRLSTLVIIVALGLVSFSSLPWPSRTITIAGRDLSISGKMLVAAAVVVVVATGAQALASAEQKDGPCYAPAQSGFWILPTLVSAVAMLILSQSNNLSTQLLICSITVAVLVILILAERSGLGLRSRLHLASWTLMEVAAFSLVALLLAAVRMTQASGPLVGWVAGVGAAAVTYLMLSVDLPSPWRIITTAVISGLVVGAIARGMIQVVETPVAYGLVLTTAIYVLVGLLRTHLRGQLHRWVVIEYLAVAAVGLLIVMVFGR